MCVLRAAGGVNEGRGREDGLGLPLLDDITADEEGGEGKSARMSRGGIHQSMKETQFYTYPFFG